MRIDVRKVFEEIKSREDVVKWNWISSILEIISVRSVDPYPETELRVIAGSLYKLIIETFGAIK